MVIVMGGSLMNASAQANLSREELQKQEQSIRRELEDLNRLLEQTKKNKKNSLGQLAAIRSKIAKREALVNGITKQVKILDDAIFTNQLDVQKLNKDLDTLKVRYAKSIIFAYN
jgi:chromosome segregation ATPase